MDDLTDFVEGLINQLGRSFFFAGFLPIIVGVAINQYIIFAPPYAGDEAVIWNFFPMVTSPWLGLFSGELLTTIVLSLGLALVLIPLNLFVIKLFEGQMPSMKAILFPFFLRHKQHYNQHYGPIAARRAERLALLQEAEETGEQNFDARFALEEGLNSLHTQKEKKEPVQALPYSRDRLAPTLYGNAWAVMEEYPLTRYGMDSVVFWPYIRMILSKENPALLTQIDNLKLLIDVVTHLAMVMGILVLEGLIFGVLRLQAGMFVMALICLVFFLGFYHAGVNYIRLMGISVAQGFDLYRLDLLKAFGLSRPVDLDDEYWVWSRLSAFIRRGEPFYFDMLSRATDDDEEDKDEIS
ncbi:MAG: hypothetical protein JXB07_00415 [Anaerolineae bacterium]|nr:hypothetical protein [Anaerolineae bacterium]